MRKKWWKEEKMSKNVKKIIANTLRKNNGCKIGGSKEIWTTIQTDVLQTKLNVSALTQKMFPLEDKN